MKWCFCHPEILRDVNMEAVPSNYVFIVSEALSQNHLLVLPATKIDSDKHIALFGGWVIRELENEYCTIVT